MFFRIRRIFDMKSGTSRAAMEQIQKMLSAQIPELDLEDITEIPAKMIDPLKYLFRPIILAAENEKGEVLGFALLLHAPDLHFMYLDYLSSSPGHSGRGLGGNLYAACREEAAYLKCVGMFFECLPDDPALSPDPEKRKMNKLRLKFYERYGARPVAGTLYETPLKPEHTDPPYLIYDPLGKKRLPSGKKVREIARAILERKYRGICPPEYIKMVCDSFPQGPIVLRPPRYVKSETQGSLHVRIPRSRQIALIMNKGHTIHHIHERGYVESPVRINSLQKTLMPSGLFIEIPVKRFSDSFLYRIHSRDYIAYLRSMTAGLKDDNPVYPYVFPLRNRAKRPKNLPLRAGYYCMDTFTPITANVYKAARSAVNCALTASEQLLSGGNLSYALVRPPGHHAEREAFGGFCYLNSAAAAALYLADEGKTAVLDIDYHHGNGQQEIFYQTSRVLTISIHGHPSFAYPYFSGFREERGSGEGEGFNINYPLKENITADEYGQTLEKALSAVEKYGTEYLVVALGLDTAKGDPTGTWPLTRDDFFNNGRMIGRLGIPVVVIQEGGYDNRVMGVNALSFFKGLWESYFS